MRYFAVFTFLILSHFSSAQTPFLYKNSSELVPINNSVYYYVDSSKNLNFEQIKQLPETNFRLNTKEYLNFGNTEYPIWLRFSLENQSDDELFLIQELNDVRLLDVCVISKNDSVRTWQTGALRPFGGRSFKRNNTVFDLGKHPKMVFLRLLNPNIYVPLKIGNLKVVTTHFHHYDLIYGGIYGILFALIIYNLFVFSVVRDRVFLYYLFCILCSGLYYGT